MFQLGEEGVDDLEEEETGTKLLWQTDIRKVNIKKNSDRYGIVRKYYECV